MNRKELKKIIDNYTEGNYLISESDKEKMFADILNLFDVIPPLNDSFNRSKKQNERMRKWFEERTGLKDALLIEHMNRIDEILNVV